MDFSPQVALSTALAAEGSETENAARLSPDEVEAGAMSFDDLPAEVLRWILAYADIPSLAALSATHRAADENVAALAADDVTWYALVQRRFFIGCDIRRISRRPKRDGVVIVNGGGSSSSLSSDGGGAAPGRKRRPATYGGANWKDAHRSLSSTMRIPETRITMGGSCKPGGGGVFASPSLHGRNAKDSVADFCGAWCMVNHAENCRTKTVTGQMERRGRRRSPRDAARERVVLPYRLDRRYIELKLCLQNTKSGFGRVVVPDVSAIHVASLDEEDYFSSWGWDKWDEEYDSTFRLIEAGPWAPKILLRHRVSDDDAVRRRDAVEAEAWNATRGAKDVVLRPFEVVVLSVHVSCPSEFAYETDALSSMSSIRVPVVADGWPRAAERARDGGRRAVRGEDVSIARFLNEDALWGYYCQLPGGCLSLTDRSRLVPV